MPKAEAGEAAEGVGRKMELMTREELLQIPAVARRIRHERDKVEAMKAKLYSPKGLDTHERVQSSGSMAPILADVVIDAEAELEIEEEELQAKAERAKELIKARLDGEDKEVMMLRYVYGLEWEEVARIMIYSQQTIFRRHQLALEKLYNKEDGEA